uniref:Tyrosinase-like protein 1 n=1 Tax=Margaritifera margaritifera TaxID=102329 RepID=TYRO1_PINMG|nr:RecName: Full=Tyrosinase-like protein 1; AltName: Full=Tyrosinase 1; Flags: Precursor [Pinctada margaritifera]CCE46151.1 tyrosinase 1 [Pinctada margaritifera]
MDKMRTLQSLIVKLTLLYGALCMLQTENVKEINKQECIQNAVYNFNTTDSKYLDPKCVTIFMDQYRGLKNLLNYTEDQMNYIFSLERAMMRKHHINDKRHKRQAMTRPRQECRTLTDDARNNLFNTIVDLKAPSNGMSRYDTIAGLHRQAIANAHMGANFLGWHRLYLDMFEMALQETRSDVVLCYWDSTLDFLMPGTSQVNTVSFSAELFGNGRGVVINGPFRFWRLPGGRTLQRFIARPGSSLTRPGVVDLIATDPRINTNSQIVFRGQGFPDPDTGRPGHSWEDEHNNTHVWVGGVMQNVVSSPQDPVFWFHHTYVDYVWELFRQKIGPGAREQYPADASGPHAPDAPMIGFDMLQNRDGYSDEHSRMYAMHPRCSNNCGNSRFLLCPNNGPMADPNRRCVSRAVNSDMVPAAAISAPEAAGFSAMSPMGAFGPAAVGPSSVGRMASRSGAARVSLQATDTVAIRAAMSEPPLQLEGPSFTSSFDDPRI